MKLILSLTLLLLCSPAVFAETRCKDAVDIGICVTLQNSKLECQNAAASGYLNSCTATVAYDVRNNSNNAAEAKISCSVAINYLKSVMGIRDSGQQKNSQSHQLSANSSDSFSMPVAFQFATQSEANNAAIKAVDCRIVDNSP